MGHARADGVRAMAAVSPTGCHAKGQPILMFNGSIRPVECVCVGDLLMGPDSRPRIVQALSRGHGEMVSIVPTKGRPFSVNTDHILSLIRTNDETRKAGEIIDISVHDYLGQSRWFRHTHKLVRTGVEFPNTFQPALDPYLLGLLLGDGSIRGSICLSTQDDAIVDAFREAGAVYGLRTVLEPVSSDRGVTYRYTSGVKIRGSNPVINLLRELGLYKKSAGGKFIPLLYRTASSAVRLKILAGLLDTDGSLTSNGYDFISKSSVLARQVAFIARSVGLAAYFRPCIKCSQTGYRNFYHRVSIFGHTDMIPCLVPHKQASPRRQKKCVLRTGFEAVPLPDDNYYGFTLDGDGRYLMGDFTITHNTGKAVMLAHLPTADALDIQPGEQLVTLVHKIELCDQLAEKLQEYNPALKVGIERERYQADKDCNLVVASVQTIGIEDKSDPDGFSRRLRKLDPARVRAVVIDEFHHALAPGCSYHRVLRYLRCLKGAPDRDPAKLFFGFTATPNRTDNIGAENLVDKLVFKRDILTMMRSGLMVDDTLRTWLCDIKSYRVDTDVDISDVKTRSGDFAVKELENTVNTPGRNKLVVDKYLEIGEGASFFAFTVDIQHSEDLSKAFCDRGIKAYPISSRTPVEERKRLIAAFKAGVIRGLVSCGVLSEGIDIPSVGCLLMCRPTQSALLYRQQVGRGFRPSPAPEALYTAWRRRSDPGKIKPYVILIDFVDITGKHQLNAAASLFGLKADFNMKGKSAVDTVEEIERIKAKTPGINLQQCLDLEALRGIAKRINLFGPVIVSDEIRTNSEYSWVTGVTAGYQLVLPDNSILTISQDELGQYEIHRHMAGMRKPIGTAPDIAGALRIADKAVPRDAVIVLKNDSTWRRLQPSEGQIPLLKRLYPEMRKLYPQTQAGEQEFVQMVFAKYSRGDVSTMISQRYTPGRAA